MESTNRIKRVMISQPMNGLTDEEIIEVRDRATKHLQQFNYEVVSTFFTDEFIANTNLPMEGVVNQNLLWLGMSIARMSTVDAVYFVKGWEDARGCKLEHLAAFMYGLELLFEDPSSIEQK